MEHRPNPFDVLHGGPSSWLLVLLSFGVAFNPVSAEARPFAYVAVRAPNPNVSVIDTASNTLVATIPIGVADGFNLSYVAITPDGSRAYVTNGTNNISVIDTATNTVAATVGDTVKW